MPSFTTPSDLIPNFVITLPSNGVFNFTLSALVLDFGMFGFGLGGVIFFKFLLELKALGLDPKFFGIFKTCPLKIILFKPRLLISIIVCTETSNLFANQIKYLQI